MKLQFILLLVVVLSGCTTTYEAWRVEESVVPPPDRTISYEEPWAEVSITRFTVNDPPLSGLVVSLDLTARSISFVTDTDMSGRTVRKFVRDTGADIAVNASPFHPVRAPARVERAVIGIHVADGTVLFAPDDRYDAFWIDTDGVPHIGGQDSAVFRTELESSRVVTAVGGFYRIVDGGENVGRRDARHPRTAVGFDRTRETLYLMVIDGRQRGHSVGVTTWELGEWMRFFGAGDAINLDGGGSSTLVVATDGRPDVANRPVHNQIPGNQRPVANQLGVQIR